MESSRPWWCAWSVAAHGAPPSATRRKSARQAWRQAWHAARGRVEGWGRRTRPIGLEHREAGHVDEALHQRVELVVPAGGEARVLAVRARRGIDCDPLVSHVAAVPAVATVQTDEVVAAHLDALGACVAHLQQESAKEVGEIIVRFCEVPCRSGEMMVGSGEISRPAP